MLPIDDELASRPVTLDDEHVNVCSWSNLRTFIESLWHATALRGRRDEKVR